MSLTIASPAKRSASYADGFVVPVPAVNRDVYIRMALNMSSVFKEYGALRDCGILSVAIVGIATEIGIEPATPRTCASFRWSSLMLSVPVTMPLPRDPSRRFASQAMRLLATAKRLQSS